MKNVLIIHCNPQNLVSILNLKSMNLTSKSKTHKILVIQFKYLGDAVFITPALTALHQAYPASEIQLLVAEEVAPIFNHLPFIKKVWAFPRTRGKAKLSKSLPFIYKLRKEKFDLSIDFAGNDRGSILSLFSGAKIRLSSIEHNPTFLQKLAYTKTIRTSLLPISWVKRHLKLLALLLKIPETTNPKMWIEADPLLEAEALQTLKKYEIICHLGTSQPKKEWPIDHWIQLYRLANNAGYKLAFSSGINAREQNLIAELKKLAPEAYALPPTNNLSMYLAVLNQAKLVISGDTGPLHFSAGLGVKVIGLFGTTDSVMFAAPVYHENESILSVPCSCIGARSQFVTCQSATACMSTISAEQVFELLKERYPLNVL